MYKVNKAPGRECAPVGKIYRYFHNQFNFKTNFFAKEGPTKFLYSCKVLYLLSGNSFCSFSFNKVKEFLLEIEIMLFTQNIGWGKR